MRDSPASERARAEGRPEGELRRGYTTGACAAAAARAAVEALLSGQTVTEVAVDLPAHPGVVFRIHRCELGPSGARCCTIKDAGDDPDVTHGAEICAEAAWTANPGIVLRGGAGVGVVTRPGLPVRVGQPAINPGPRRIIVRAVRDALGARGTEDGVEITISVPGGQQLAAKTLNPKLGIVGGISILGTTGIVVPYSTAAFRASIATELRVAADGPSDHGAPGLVLATGSRSEEYARRAFPDWPALFFVQVGDHVGFALRQARRRGFATVVVAGMVGKVSKLAQGRMQTHVDEGGIDFAFLAEVAREAGVPVGSELLDRIRSANTARHVQLLLRRAGVAGLETRLAERAAGQVLAFVDGAFDVEVLVYDVKGELLARGKAGRQP